ncbi:FliH/SctL family protein [Pseudomonas sp. LB1P83]
MSELPTRPSARILRADQATLWTDGYAFLQAARDEAQLIRQDSTEWLERARTEGFESARQEGAEQISALLAETSVKVESYLASLETSLVDLALGVVLEVLERLEEAERIVGFTRRALAAFRQDQALTLFVPSLEVERVRDRLKSEPDSLPAITVKSDDQLHAGQARLSSPVGSVELGLDAQLQALRSSLLPFSEVTA